MGGRAFVWGDEWIEYDSEWSSMPRIPELWLQVFAWIAPANRCMLTGIGPIGLLLPFESEPQRRYPTATKLG